MVLYWYVLSIFPIFQRLSEKLRSCNTLQTFKYIASFPRHNPTQTRTRTTHKQKSFTTRRFAKQLLTQVMNSQMNSELLDKILESDMILLSGGKFDVNLLGPDLGLDLEEDLNITKPYSIIDELMDNPPAHQTKYQQFTNTITSTIFSTVFHL